MPRIRNLQSLLSGSGIIMLSRLAGAGVGFLTQFLLVKLMGAHQLGIFYAASSLAAILGVIAAQGYPLVAPRFVGRYRNKRDDALCGGFAGHALREGVAAAGLLALAVILWSLLWPALADDEIAPYVIAGGMILAIAALNILTNIAGGMRAFALCYVPEGLFRPIAFFLLVAAAGLAGLTLSATAAMAVFALITAALAVAVMVLLKRRMPPIRWRGAAKPALARRWRGEAWQLILLAIFTNFFADFGILVAAPFLSRADVAVFGLCLKLALLVGYFAQIAQQMAVPDMADARHRRDYDRLRRAAWRSIVLPSAITLAGMLAVYAAGESLLGYFGTEFVAGRRALLILLAAQLLRSLAGPSAHLLTLSGIQRVNMGLAASTLLILFLASAVLTPALAIEGAAWAVFVAYAFWIGISAMALHRLREPAVDIVWLSLHRLRLPARG